MGLTKGAAGENGKGRLVALAGNPNVGKSTLFNHFTGMRQHTGNWAGKTVGAAYGHCTYNGRGYTLVDIPGAYSLAARSAEEEAARDFICYGGAEAVVVVCDATCLCRTVGLALQIMEITGSVAVCVNLMDEAEKKGIEVDTAKLAERMGVPVIGVSASRGEGTGELLAALEVMPERPPFETDYGEDAAAATAPLKTFLESVDPRLPAGWLAMRLAEGDESAARSLRDNLGIDVFAPGGAREALEKTRGVMAGRGISAADLGDISATRLMSRAEEVCAGAVKTGKRGDSRRDRRIDAILTHPVLGYPVMAAMLAVILWITIAGANVPSRLMSEGLFWLGDFLRDAAKGAGAPEIALSLIFDGIYRTLSWVVSVMLPPMAIFFPLFTLLEDLGYLPRVAFNLDGLFKKCSACGKQGLTMCMGLGCNAAGVIGCRIIDSPRERLIAIITNSFIPCNGRLAPPIKGQLSGGAPPLCLRRQGRRKPARRR